jgi:hypothetical protein
MAGQNKVARAGRKRIASAGSHRLNRDRPDLNLSAIE